VRISIISEIIEIEIEIEMEIEIAMKREIVKGNK